MWTPKTIWHRLFDRWTTPIPCAPLPVPVREFVNLACSSLRPHPDVVTRQSGDNIFLVHLTRGTAFRLNHSGLKVWELLGTAHSVREITERMCACYNERPEIVASDVQSIINELARNSLLDVTAEAAPCAG